MHTNNWKYKDNSTFIPVANNLASALNISEKLALLLVQRGVKNFEQAKAYFRPSWENTHSPFLLLNMEKAVEQIQKVLAKKEKILVYGDYDVDGTTAVAMVYHFLKEVLGAHVLYYIPNRYSEGYGVSEQGIDFAIAENIKVLITLDCGIKAIDKIKKAHEAGIEVIVGDHHLPGEILPKATILNPKQSNCPYPFKELSGAGVGFKLIQALCEKMNLDPNIPFSYLDLLAIGTGADMVSLVDENRIFMHYGLQKLNENPSSGVAAILKVAACKNPITMRDIGYAIGPRINAAGRVDDASKIIELLCSGDKETEKIISQAISEENEYRRELDQETTLEALSILYSKTDLDDLKSTVIYKADWNKGVVGIVASRIQEKIYKPTIVLTQSNGFITGSARSVAGFNIHDAIASCSHLLESFGGHAFAAGLTLKTENLKEFSTLFEKACENIAAAQNQKEISIDTEIELDELDDKFFRILWLFEPFGVDNAAPIFESKNLLCFPGIKVMGGKHLKMRVCPKNNPSVIFEAIAFNQIQHYEKIKAGQAFHICFTPELNSWNGQKNIQLNIKDFAF